MKFNKFFIKVFLSIFPLFIFSGCFSSYASQDVLTNELSIADECKQNKGDISFVNDCYDLMAYKNSFAQIRLGLDAQDKGQFEEAMKRYEEAKKQGNFYAVSFIAGLYSNGLGVDMDEDEAFSLLKSTKDIDPIAAYRISYIYFSKGDTENGIKYLSLAAGNGVKNAQNELSIIYSNGQYIAPNTQQSEYWASEYKDNSDDFTKKILGK